MEAGKAQALRTAMVSMIKSLQDQINGNTDATTFEGETKAQYTATLKTLFQGTTSLTSEQIDAKVEQALADIANLGKADVGLALVENFGIATQLEAEDQTTHAADKYVTVERTWQSIEAWWAKTTSTSPEALDTMNEITAAIEANQDAYAALETIANGKVSSTDFNTAVTNLNDAIAAVVADDVTFAAGTSTTTAASVKQVHDHVTAQVLATSNADVDELTAIIGDVDSYVKGDTPWPA